MWSGVTFCEEEVIKSVLLVYMGTFWGLKEVGTSRSDAMAKGAPIHQCHSIE
jgi:hypothetical protein